MAERLISQFKSNGPDEGFGLPNGELVFDSTGG